MSKQKPLVIDSYEPNYENECISCGSAVTVSCVKGGKVVHDTDLCGVCTWGESAMIDPKAWNE